MISESEYLDRRAHEEREALMRAGDPRVREVHRELAEAYELRLRLLAAEARRSTIHLVTAA